MIKRPRLCWWCNKKLSAVSHAEISDHDGNKVLVHKVCVPNATREVKPVTAARVVRTITAVPFVGKRHD